MPGAEVEPVRYGLGHGVSVVEAGGRLVVESGTLDLGWTPPRGRVPGTAVRWRGGLWEVKAARGAAGGGRWELEPWPEDAVVRHTVTLDEAAVATLAAARQEGRRDARLRGVAALLLPILGFLPARLQRRWRDDWGFPALTATRLSAYLELAVAGFGLVHLLGVAFGGGPVLPRGLGWLGPAGPLLFAESLLRLHLSASDGEPVGSAVGLPALPFLPGQPSPPEPEPSPRAGGARFGAGGWTLRTVLLAFAPAEHQVFWTVRHRLPRTLLTLLGGAAELLGGLTTWRADAAADSPWLLLDLFLLAEGAARLAAAAAGRPLGSLLGLPLGRLWPRISGVRGPGGASTAREEGPPRD